MKDTLEVPPEIKLTIEAEQYADRQAKADRSIRRALHALDPDLDLLRVRPDIAPEIVPPGAIPGRWHVRNKAAKPIPTFAPIETPDGGFREPDSGILREMARRDMRKREVRRALYERQEREEARSKQAKDLETEQRRDEMAEDLRAGWRVAGTGGLRQRAWGRG
jgi:hypothetical protein